ncbi:MAG: hypothetical protein M3258_06630, partial [Thermoproteota archaeon]|nr:hypothetical protein [Thermoproteota archaeon]
IFRNTTHPQKAHKRLGSKSTRRFNEVVRYYFIVLFTSVSLIRWNKVNKLKQTVSVTNSSYCSPSPQRPRNLCDH